MGLEFVIGLNVGLNGLLASSGKVTPNPLIPNAETPKVCLLPSLPQTIAKAGIGETPRSSKVVPLTPGAPGPNIPAGNDEDNSGDEKNKPISSFNILSSKTDSVAGFHCMAPEISNGCAVAAPPIDILTAPTPCIMCPACENIIAEKLRKITCK